MFKDNLKELRKTKNISQHKLSEELGVSAATVGHWEVGYCEPNIAQLKSLAKFFEISLDELLS